MNTGFPDHIQLFLERLAEKRQEVWLIGSRANGTATLKSDWDLLVFGTELLLKELEAAPSVMDADVLIVVDGDAFRSPWASADTGTAKSGSLINWNWRVLNNDAATYEGTKWPNDWGSLMRAIRLVPAA